MGFNFLCVGNIFVLMERKLLKISPLICACSFSPTGSFTIISGLSGCCDPKKEKNDTPLSLFLCMEKNCNFKTECRVWEKMHDIHDLFT